MAGVKRRTNRPSRNWSIQDKLMIIRRIRNGETKASVSRLTKTPESTLRGWCKNEEKIELQAMQAANPPVFACANGGGLNNGKKKKPLASTNSVRSPLHSPITQSSTSNTAEFLLQHPSSSAAALIGGGADFHLLHTGSSSQHSSSGASTSSSRASAHSPSNHLDFHVPPAHINSLLHHKESTQQFTPEPYNLSVKASPSPPTIKGGELPSPINTAKPSTTNIQNLVDQPLDFSTKNISTPPQIQPKSSVPVISPLFDINTILARILAQNPNSSGSHFVAEFLQAQMYTQLAHAAHAPSLLIAPPPPPLIAPQLIVDSQQQQRNMFMSHVASLPLLARSPNPTTPPQPPTSTIAAGASSPQHIHHVLPPTPPSPQSPPQEPGVPLPQNMGQLACAPSSITSPLRRHENGTREERRTSRAVRGREILHHLLETVNEVKNCGNASTNDGTLSALLNAVENRCSDTASATANVAPAPRMMSVQEAIQHGYIFLNWLLANSTTTTVTGTQIEQFRKLLRHLEDMARLS